MSVSAWDEIRTAYHVARAGTVSGAAQDLGVHHATVIRHIDSLEARLGAKLFQRHARGYTPTEAGNDLLRVAQVTDDQFAQLASRISGGGAEVSGDLTITSLVELSSLIAPVLTGIQREHPELSVRYLTGERLFRLEYGEAHVAVRAGRMPQDPDNVVQPFVPECMALYASRDYVDFHGLPKNDSDLSEHRFVGHGTQSTRGPSDVWMRNALPSSSIVFRGADNRVLAEAVMAGVGLGFLSPWDAARNTDLVCVMPNRPEWTSPMWLVTHVDLHRTAKVQTALAALKQASQSWPEAWFPTQPASESEADSA